MVVLAGCTHDAAIQRAFLAEQAEFALYHHVSDRQATSTRTWRSPPPSQRMAYLQELGLVQRFQALDPLDQEAIRAASSGLNECRRAPVPLGRALQQQAMRAGTRTGNHLASSFNRSPSATIRGIFGIAWMSTSSRGG
jgi:hypothetical protein